MTGVRKKESIRDVTVYFLHLKFEAMTTNEINFAIFRFQK